MIDLKTALTYLIQQGLEDYGYGVRSMDTILTPASSPNKATITVKRSGAQDEDDRPLITLTRIAGPNISQFYLGNLGSTRPPEAPSIPNAASTANTQVLDFQVDDKVRIGIEADQNTGGQSLVDLLVMQIPVIFQQSWSVLTAPPSVGGYGLFNIEIQGGEDSVDAFAEVGGKVIYKNYYDVTATYTVDSEITVLPSPELDNFLFNPPVNGVIINEGGE